ncbi:IclR family transcriptional regulator [Streptomyces sp. NPDC055078]
MKAEDPAKSEQQEESATSGTAEKAGKPERRSGRVQSVARACGIIDAVAESRTAPRAQEIATALGLNLTTAVHLLNTLVDAGYLEKHGRTYALGTSKVLSLYDRISAAVRPSPQALAALHRLSDDTGETANLSYWVNGEVVLAAAVEGRQAVRVAALQVGSRGDLHARAAGKCLLAFGPPDRLEHFLAANPLSARTRNTVTSPELFRSALEVVRLQGYALDSEEYAEGICGAAVPLDDGKWPMVALSVIAPAERFTRNRHALVAALLRASGRAEPDGDRGTEG